MPSYRLSSSALRDFSDIITWLHKKVSASVSVATESALWEACHDIAKLPAIGHSRIDLTSKPLLFYAVLKYFLMFERTEEGVLVHAIVHSSRDVAAILKRRKP